MDVQTQPCKMSSIIPAMHWSAALHPRIRACSLSAGSAFLSRSSSGAANARLQLCSLQRNSQGRQALFEAQHVVKYRETRCGAGRSRRDSELDGLDAALHILEVLALPVHRHQLTSEIDKVRSMHPGNLK